MQKITASLMTLALLLALCTAQAEAPAAQFGFTGWPYRQSVGCSATAVPSQTTPPQQSPTARPQAPTPIPPSPTAVPTAVPTAAPRPTATAKPAVTQKPSMVVDYTTESAGVQEQIAWNLLNQDRAANGLSALPLDSELSRLARLKSQDMRDKHYFAHESPTYGRAKDLLTRYGYAFTSVGENIAHHATIQKAQAAFLSSVDHRRNMMSTAWKKVGIGVAYDAQGFVYLTQLFVR